MNSNKEKSKNWLINDILWMPFQYDDIKYKIKVKYILKFYYCISASEILTFSSELFLYM